MRSGLIFPRARYEEKLLTQAAPRRDDVEPELLNTDRLVLDLDALPEVDVVLDREISQSRALHALNVLERNGVRTINSHDAARIAGDKALTSSCVWQAGVPTPRVKVAFSQQSALNANEAPGHPVVFEPVDGSWGRLMARMKSRSSADAILEHKAHLSSHYHGIFYLQEYVNKPDRDIRAFVIDGGTVCRRTALLTIGAPAGHSVREPRSVRSHQSLMNRAFAPTKRWARCDRRRSYGNERRTYRARGELRNGIQGVDGGCQLGSACAVR